MNSADFEQLILVAATELERLSIAHAIVGSVASSRFGVQRATLDIDFVADIKPSQIPALVRALTPDFYIDEELVMDAIQRRSSFNALHLETGAKLDFFALKNRPYDRVALDRRSPEIPAFMTAEDVLLGKLEWYRAGDETSERQWGDVLGILNTAPAFDLEYARHWANEIGVLDLLERAESQCGLTT